MTCSATSSGFVWRESLDHLATLGTFRDEFLRLLEPLNGRRYAVREGRPVCAEEPIPEGTPIAAQVMETFVITRSS